MLSSFFYVPANVIVQTPEWKLNFEVFLRDMFWLFKNISMFGRIKSTFQA